MRSESSWCVEGGIWGKSTGPNVYRGLTLATVILSEIIPLRSGETESDLKYHEISPNPHLVSVSIIFYYLDTFYIYIYYQ